MGPMFVGKDADKLQRLVVAIGYSKAPSSSESAYTSWIHYFDEGKGSRSSLVLEALLTY